MNKLVKKSLAGVLAGVMAATSLVGSMTAFATISDDEANAPAKLEFGKAATFEKKDGDIQDVYYFETAASTVKDSKDVFYNFTFTSDAHVSDEKTNTRDDKPATVKIYKYNSTTGKAETEAKVTLVYDANIDPEIVGDTAKNRDKASERVLFNKDDSVNRIVSTTYSYHDEVKENVKLEEKTVYMAKVETFGTWKDTKETDLKKQTKYLKAYLTVQAYEEAKSDWDDTEIAGDEYSLVKEAAGFNGTYYGTRYYSKAVSLKYQGSASDIVVPDMYEGKRVVKFLGVTDAVPHSRITSVTLGKYVEEVGGFGDEVKNPFFNLKTVTLNEGLKTINANAFRYCTGLSGQLVIPSTVTTIGNHAFYETGYSSAKIQSKDTKTIGTQALGFAGILNEATADPTDTYPGVKAGFFVVAPADAKEVFDWGKKNDVPVIDPANCTHVYGDTTVKKATYWAKGSETKTCLACGAVDTKEIAQKKVALSTVKSAKKGQITVKTKSVDAAIKGYKIQYATKKDFSNAKTVKVASTKKALSKTVKGLKSGKKYYVRVRVYKSGKNGAWSAAKTVKVK